MGWEDYRSEGRAPDRKPWPVTFSIRGLALGGAQLPEKLAEKSEPVVEIRRREREVADQAAYFCLDGGWSNAMWVAVDGERFEEKVDETFFFSSSGERGLGCNRFWFGLADEFV
jgi:hypothetical protein